VREQIRAAEELGIHGWVLWNARSAYERAYLRDASGKLAVGALKAGETDKTDKTDTLLKADTTVRADSAVTSDTAARADTALKADTAVAPDSTVVKPDSIPHDSQP
jgi:hypothetical protein